MMEKTNINWVAMTDNVITEEIGKYIKNQRLSQNKTQIQIARDAGINRWTVSQIENGKAISMTSFIQILRVMGLLNVLDVFKIEPQISPIELAKIELKKRKRARTNRNKKQTKNKRK